MTRTIAAGMVTSMLLIAPMGAQVPRAVPQDQLDAERHQVDAQMADRHLDDGVTIPSLKLAATPVKDVLAAITAATGLKVQYDRNVPELDRPVTVNLSNTSLQNSLRTVLPPIGVAFTALGAKSVFVYSDTPENRQKFAESVRTFQLTAGDPARIAQQLLQQPSVSTAGGIRPIIMAGRASRTITVRATADRMAEIAKFIAANDKSSSKSDPGLTLVWPRSDPGLTPV